MSNRTSPHPVSRLTGLVAAIVMVAAGIVVSVTTNVVAPQSAAAADNCNGTSGSTMIYAASLKYKGKVSGVGKLFVYRVGNTIKAMTVNRNGGERYMEVKLYKRVNGKWKLVGHDEGKFASFAGCANEGITGSKFNTFKAKGLMKIDGETHSVTIYFSEKKE